jgi:hypothetical protein
MTTGATGQLGLALPVQGELSGTWGDTVNNGITQYTNIAIAGTLTLTNDGAVTLANTTGDASASNITSTLTGAGTVTAQFAIVKVTGTLTVAKVVTGPSYSKTYTVVNSATGGIVTFKASGQTGVSVAVGETAFVYFNGTDYVKVVGTATAGAAGGSTTQVQFNSSGILAGSSNLTWDGTTLSSTQVNITGQGTLRLQDTTGGEYVGLRSPGTLGASYTLTFPADDGTSGQALITDGSGVLSWSTAASGDVYGPASSTDNAVARFDSTTGKLLQNSVVLIGDTGAVTGVTDLTASGSVTLNGGTANGVTYLNGSKVVTSGSALTFDGTNFATTGKIGAGTSSPTAKLQATSASAANLILENTTATTGKLWQLNSSSSGVLNFGVYGVDDYMFLTSAGNLGLGVTPSAWNTLTTMQIKNASFSGYGNHSYTMANAFYQTGWKYIASEYALQYFQNATGGQHQWNIAPSGTAGNAITFTQAMTLDASGNLGIGTTTPDANLTVNGAASFAAGTALLPSIARAGDLNTGIWFPAADTIAASTAGSERIRIDSAGNLGLGVTPSAWGGSFKAFETTGTSLGSNAAGSSYYLQNSYYNGTNFIYTTTAAASYYQQVSGAHRWYNTASGTAGNAITFTQAATLTASGEFLVGRTSLSISGVKVDAEGLFGSIKSGNWSWSFGASASINAFVINDTTSGSSTERMRIDSSGNLGIGTATPGVKLDVAGTIRGTSTSITGAAGGTITPTSATTNQYTVTALGAAATFAIPSGTPIDGQKLVIRIEDNGTARALTWTTSAGGYRVIGTTLPTTTVISKTVYVGCIYNSADSFWDVVAVAQQA